MAEHRVKAERRPAEPDVTELDAGVFRAQLPIEFTGLGHVNMYVFEDERGVAVTDPGLPDDESWEGVGDRLRQIGAGIDDVHTVVLTHSHADHFGCAGRLAEESGADIVAHRAFRVVWLPETYPDVVEASSLAGSRTVPDDDIARQIGLRASWTDRTFAPTGDHRSAVVATQELRRRYGPPVPTRRVADGDVLRLGRRDWRVVATPGHTADHLCLYSEEGGVLVAGDHVLPEITPHVSGTQPYDAVREYMTSLDRVVALPSIELVLPAHGGPFAGLADRVAAIKQHHRERLERLLDIAEAIGPATVEAYSRELFPPSYAGFMAESETYAHLVHLQLEGRMRATESDGDVLFGVDPTGPIGRPEP